MSIEFLSTIRLLLPPTSWIRNAQVCQPYTKQFRVGFSLSKFSLQCGNNYTLSFHPNSDLHWLLRDGRVCLTPIRLLTLPSPLSLSLSLFIHAHAADTATD